MKILFIVPNYLPHIGGVEKHIDMLCKELLKDGHSITILVMKSDNSYRDYEKIGMVLAVWNLQREITCISSCRITQNV